MKVTYFLCYTLLLGTLLTGCKNKFNEPVYKFKSINPNSGGDIIEKDENAYDLTWNHRTREVFGDGRLKNGRSHYFTKSFLIDTMLNQQGALGLNFYPGLDKDGSKEAFLLVVAVNKNGNDMVGQYEDIITGEKKKYLIGITEMKCPENCDTNKSPLLVYPVPE